ncbi:MAG: family 78 glycoside hydrolase catalytic domain [Marinilabiliales bacterium]|nr:family 78 glycoside hydrolase catalytic domain [Marinilabiliales bacterium]
MKNLILPLLLMVAQIAWCAPTDPPKVVELRCEYLKNPLGIDLLQPRLSWQMVRESPAATQIACIVEVASSPALLVAGTPDLWSTGERQTHQSTQMLYDGKPLTSGQQVFWHVRIKDEKGHWSDWSETATWEMGLLRPDDWKASWIGAPDLVVAHQGKLAAPQFRKTFLLSKPIRSARAYVTGLGFYELSLNGKKSGDHLLSPNQTNYDKRKEEKWDEKMVGNMTTTVLYETHDITDLLHPGENVAGILLGNGWYYQEDRFNEKSLWYNTPRTLAQLVIHYADNSWDTLVTDSSWKCAKSPILSNAIHTGEIYDARLEQPGWDRPGFDDGKWSAAQVVQAPTGELKAQCSPPDRVVRTIHPLSVTETSKGTYRFDLGEMISGWVRLKVTGQAGSQIRMRFIEELGPAYDQSDGYILKGGKEEIWEPRFTWHGFRYVDVTGSSKPLTADNLEGKVVNTDIQPAGTFETSNPLLNKILDNYRRTESGNVHGGLPSDCPHRERLGYTGDGQISATAALYNFDMAAFYTKWMRDIADAQNHRNGYVPNTTPYQGGGGGTAWGSALVIIPWNMYLFYGDSQILRKHYAAMKQWIQYLHGALDEEGILRNQGLGEWVPPELVVLPPDYVNSCYYYENLALMQQIAGVLGELTDKVHFGEWAEAAQTALYKQYYQAGKTTFSVGKQSAAVFPLAFGIAKTEDTGSLFDQLVRQVVTDNKAHFDTGILATPLLLEVLTTMGRHDVAYTLMNQHDYPSFGYMIDKGATTLWETWLGDASHSHPMFGSVCAWFYKYLGGIAPDPAQPGFRNVILHPWPVADLKYVRTSYPSPYGTIRSDWKWEADKLILEVTIPPNSTATVHLPALSPDETRVKVLSPGHAEIVLTGIENGCAIYKISSGSYRFESDRLKQRLRQIILPTPVIQPADTLADQSKPVRVVMRTDTEETLIRYTTDGSEPTHQSRLYNSPFLLNRDALIKAKAFRKASDSSFTAQTNIRFADARVNGLKVRYYEGAWKQLPDFERLPAVKVGAVFELSLAKITPTQDLFGLTFDGKIRIDKDGEYTFYLRSNDGTNLFLDGKPVIDNDGMHGADTEKSGTVRLKPGLHPIRLLYFQAGGGMFLEVKYSGPGIDKQPIPATILFK